MKFAIHPTRRTLPSGLALCFFAALPAVALAQADTANKAGIEFFEKRIRPVLVEKCYECHSAKAKKVKGGLLLDTRGIQRGGDTGAGGGAGRCPAKPVA